MTDFGIGWCLIPPTILGRKDLSHAEILLLGRILGLLGEKGYCYASNAWLGKQINITGNRISRLISHLIELNLIRIEVIKDQNKKIIERRIYTNTLLLKSEGGIVENDNRGIVENIKESNRDKSNREENKNRGEPPRIKNETVSHKGISLLKDSLFSTIQKMDEKKKICSYEWQDKAFRYAKDLGIDWNDPLVIKENAKGRWLSMFKRGGSRIESAYSFCVDYNKNLNSLEKIKLFFWKYGGGNKSLT